MSRSAELRSFPFAFSPDATTALDDQRLTTCDLFEVPCLRSCASSGGNSLCSWLDYYTARGLQLSSPIALLTHAPLTLLRALHWLAAQPCGRGLLADDACCTVLCLGANKETRQWPIFLELGALLPRVHLHIIFVGPDVPCGGAAPGPTGVRAAGTQAPSKQAGTSAGCGSVRLSFARGLYHECAGRLARELGTAHLVFGPNAGLAAYPSWRPTLQLLALPDAPLAAFFTDFCEEAALRAAQAATACAGVF
ncbi:hypothetical protein WJX81_007683 [Elliptochloris bilobata]|uniref:Mitochondrial splicing suppressor 51-like C-terminal domain-containing protein n=1 Tax=Elliptochloris bilobata TaxID=381761 RepID=A0AAW1R2S7_9CHLO